MVPACLVLAFGVWGVVNPYTYMELYLEQTAHTTLSALSSTQPGVALLLEVIFRANGLGMTMSGIMAIFIILFPFRKGEKWSVLALAIVGGIGLIGEIIFEMMVLR